MLSAGLTNILYMVGGLAGLVTVLYCVIRRQLYLNSDTVLFSVFLLFSWISAIAAFGISLSFFCSKFICAWMMILAVYYASRTVPDSVKLLRVSVLAISVADFLICLSALYHATQTLFIGISPASVVTGCFRNGRLCALRNANRFGFVCASLLFVSILGLVSTKGVRKIYYIVAAFLGWFCLGLTGCRTGAIGVAAALGIVTFSSGYRRFCGDKKDCVIFRYLSVTAAFLLVMILAAESFLLPKDIYKGLLDIFSQGKMIELRSRRILDDDGTFSSRTYIWASCIRSCFRSIRHFLLGVSTLSKETIGDSYSGHHEIMEAHAHNTFLEIMRIHGFSGLLIWVALIVTWGITAVKSLFDREGSLEVSCLAACAAGILIIGIAEPVPLIYSSSMYLTIPFFMICGNFERLRREKA